jgi:hypothetical protein
MACCLSAGVSGPAGLEVGLDTTGFVSDFVLVDASDISKAPVDAETPSGSWITSTIYPGETIFPLLSFKLFTIVVTTFCLLLVDGTPRAALIVLFDGKAETGVDNASLAD